MRHDLADQGYILKDEYKGRSGCTEIGVNRRTRGAVLIQWFPMLEEWL